MRILTLILSVLVCIAGCAGNQRVDRRVEGAALAGQYGYAREWLQRKLSDDRRDRSYLLDRMRLLILTLADGQPDAAERTTEELYSLLRTQGLNADRTVSSVVVNENVKIWKGEPFEQALAYTYIGIQKAMRAEWDNARAAILSSLFMLRDFGQNERGQQATVEDIARKAAEMDARGGNGDALIDRGYVPARTDFTLGYLLGAISAQALGRTAEAEDYLAEAERLDPRLKPLTGELRVREYNLVLVVDYGRGPVKQAYGPDGALARFVPVTPSDHRTLHASVRSIGGVPEMEVAAVPAAIDVNRMAQSLMWNSLEGIRQAKSVFGNLMFIGGVAVAATPRQQDESEESRRNRALIGSGIALVGLLLKSGAAADTRHCEFLPQRTYIVPLRIERPSSSVQLDIEGDPRASIILAGLDPVPRGETQLRYVRLTGGGEPWRTSGRVMYANDRYQWRVPGDDLPYIFGGRCVRAPSPEVMSRYHASGNLAWMTSTDLANIYREEGIMIEPEDSQGRSERHVLEGGNSLVAPLPGTVGYMRLFGQEHAPYKPRSQALRDAIERHQREKQQSNTSPRAWELPALPSPSSSAPLTATQSTSISLLDYASTRNHISAPAAHRHEDCRLNAGSATHRRSP
jgi:tetratricopeptide (TPR) repeat protein